MICLLCCLALTLAAVACALAEGAELATAASVKAYLPTVGWDDYTARDTDGDGEIMISYGSGGKTASDSIDVYCQCLDGAARVTCYTCEVPEDADPLKVYEQLNEFNLNLTFGRWLYNEEEGYIYYDRALTARDGGYRYGSASADTGFVGDSFAAGLYRLRDGSFATDDGALQAAPGQAVQCWRKPPST